MKPVCLTMSAFGPYAVRQVIDFSQLQGRSFFLIHGPTGAGKTTILDAMCFALYGDTSVALRDGKNMRSDHAEQAIATEVDFEFVIGADKYRIKRSPEQHRPKKRGDGLTQMPAEAELWRLNGFDSQELLASGWSKVTEKVETLLGFKSAQFRQVVLLPQGEFRKLLTANSTERQEIMQILFKTELYRNIEEKLKNNAQDLKKSFDELNKEHQWVLQEAAAGSPEILAERLRQNQCQLQSIIDQLAAAGAELAASQEAITAGRLIQEKFNEKLQAERMLAELKVQASVVEEKRLELARAQQAAALADVDAMVEQLATDEATAQKLLQQREQDLAVVREKQAVAERQLASEKAREGEREAVAREIIFLNEISGKMTALTSAMQQVHDCQLKAGQAFDHKTAVNGKLNSISNSAQEKMAEHQRYAELAAETGKLQLDLGEKKRIVARRQLLDDTRTDLQSVQARLAENRQVTNEIEQQYLAVKEQLNDLQEAWVKGQAAIMAASLADGAPCPVCGSTDHPRPAAKSGHLPTESQIKNQQVRRDQLEKELERCREGLAKLQTNRDTLLNKAGDLEQDLGEYACMEQAKLQLAVREAQALYDQGCSAEKQVRVVKEQLAVLEEEQRLLIEQTEQAELDWQQANSMVKAAEAVASERRSVIPAEFQQPDMLARAIIKAEEWHGQLKAAWEQAQETAQSAARELAKSQTALDNAGENLRVIQERYLQEKEKFAGRLTAAGFMDRQDYDRAKKAPAYVQKLAEQISAFDRDLNGNIIRAQRAEEAVKGLTVPDMAGLEEYQLKVQARHDEVLAQHTKLTSQVEQEKHWQDRLTLLTESTDKLAGKYRVVGLLAEVANGSNEYKLTFQRFVLAALLDDVAEAANERLKMMSRGRYHLQRTMERARKNSAGGLELEVFDNFTGAARGVGTLSGGETFLASLSLALGLADVVQSYAGGTRLDTIFVDEGFGTLDPETLDFAIKALIDLQQGGRLVGIISHVPELKERIDARLEVIQIGRGSKAEFKVG